MTISPRVTEPVVKAATLLFVAALLSMSVGYRVNAQKKAKPAEILTDAQERENRKRVGERLAPAIATTRTSPFAPPDDGDHSFSTDDAPKLDTGCIFRSSGPIVFNIEIKRFIGKLKADGTLADADKLIASGALSPTVKLIIPGFDVDSGAVAQGIQPERDRVSVNGQAVGFLQGENNQWILNSYEVDIRKIKFAERGVDGSDPTGGVNQIRIDIDTANSGEEWCTSVDWGSAGFRALSPIILIHGNKSDDDFFVRQEFTKELDERTVAYDNKVFDDRFLSGTANFISANAVILNKSIPRIARSFGAKTVHLVAHSKGGLDARAYLASYQPQHDSDFKAISLTTLSTPHNGSVLADLSISRHNAAQQVGFLGDIVFEGFPLFTQQLTAIADLFEIDNGRRNLTTSHLASFNSTNIQRLGRATTFNTVAAHMDLNSSGAVNRFFPDEFAELRQESLELAGMDLITNPPGTLSTVVVDSLYQILRTTRGISVSTVQDQFCVPLTHICRKMVTLTSVDNTVRLGNDSLVTIPSAEGVGTLGPLTTNTFTFEGSNGRNHSSVANRGVAQRVLPWLVNTDRAKGGLR
jgi:triacylglycerol lipase